MITRRSLRVLHGLATGLLVLAFGPVAIRGQSAPSRESVEQKVDAIFARWDSTATPGCTAGVATGGSPMLEAAYGMADLEHGVVNTPQTIFEAGSVSKQFTAAAVLLLARDGRLSLDDPAAKYVPELPPSAATVTIRQMLEHTSGLRDWGTMAGLGGWPRGSRVHTHAHVLQILARQSALNFQPGTDWSYSNSGYNLAAIIVSRVAGEPFAEFTRKRLFEPLGMTRTSWRDDHTRIVKDRALAYQSRQGGFETSMPFENVHGNGGLLTTVGDLLRWNENFVAPKVGDAPFVAAEQQSGRLSNGREHGYGLGLFLGTYNGVREVSHGGATAGYRSFLARYPDQHLSVAVLCNASTANPGAYAHAVADLYLPARSEPAAATAPLALTDDVVSGRVGTYRSRKRGVAIVIVREKDGLRIENGPRLQPRSATTVTWGGGAEAEFVPPASATAAMTVRVRNANGTEDVFERVSAATPSAADLASLAGEYRSTDADVTFTVALEGDRLTMKSPPDRSWVLRPTYADAFVTSEGDTVIVRRDARGRATGLFVGLDRAWDVRFERVVAAGSK